MDNENFAYYLAKQSCKNINKEISDMELEARVGRVTCLSTAEFRRRVVGNMRVTPPPLPSRRDEDEPSRKRKRSRCSYSASPSSSESEDPLRSEIELLKAKVDYLERRDEEKKKLIKDMKNQMNLLRGVVENLTFRLDQERGSITSQSSTSSVQIISSHNTLPISHHISRQSDRSVRDTRSRFDITESEIMVTHAPTPSRNVSPIPHRISRRSRDLSVESCNSPNNVTERESMDSRVSSSSGPFDPWRNMSHRITRKSKDTNVEASKSRRLDSEGTVPKKSEKTKTRERRHSYGRSGCALCGGPHSIRHCDRVTRQT